MANLNIQQPLFQLSSLRNHSNMLIWCSRNANLHCYTSCTLTTLHCSKVSFLQCCHMKRYNKIFTKMWGVYSLLWDTVYVYIYIFIYIHIYSYLCQFVMLSLNILKPLEKSWVCWAITLFTLAYLNETYSGSNSNCPLY